MNSTKIRSIMRTSSFINRFEQFSRQQIMVQYVRYLEGQIGIILSVPHGGIKGAKKQILESIPDRVCKCENPTRDHKCLTVNSGDSCTIHLGFALRKAIKENIGYEPFLIINDLHRSKHDPNREMRIGAQCPEAETVFKEYHSRVKEAINTFSNSLLIDLHGMKYERITQIGYGI